MRQPQPDLALTYAPAYGARVVDGGAEFRIYSHSATGMRVLLYDTPSDMEPVEVIELDPERNRFGDVWKLAVAGVGHGQLYHLQADGPQNPDRGFRFDPRARLIDPYAQALADDFQSANDGLIRPPKCVVVDDQFDWSGDRPLNRELAEQIIYEMHVGGFTRSPTSRVRHAGTYLGVIEKIPYLQALGVTAVELMPVNEFPILGPDGRVKRHANYWGYDPMAFFSPHRGYAVGAEPGAQVTEFKRMVQALHQAGIEVILDVVFNHTCEGNERGPTISFKGLENNVYYMTEQGGRYYKNYSGCGNTLNCNHPIVIQLILECLRHWVVNYHVDGFRFDVAAVFRRGRDGGILGSAPLVEAIAEDPYLSRTKMIAEAWDAGGAYLVGSFGGPRWAEWNGVYRDDVRKFWKGQAGMRGGMATRLAGSSDLYERSGRQPACSVNFITSHDGFTLNDLVSYSHKHNEANGENNRDGDNNNLSENYGHEGPTSRVEIESVRLRQIKNFLATLMLSQGVPMLVMGDECRRTQRGNNNAYCQDNPISWLNWDLVRNNREVVRFCRSLIKFRRSQPTLRRTEYLRGEPNGHDPRPEVGWFDTRGETARWDGPAKSLCCLLTRPPADQDPDGAGRDMLLMMNAECGPQEFQFPATAALSTNWRQFINTAADAPRDVFPNLDGPAPPKSGRLILPARSLVCYVAERRGRC
jgi:glycogen operon protein